MTDLLGGHSHAYFNTLIQALPYIKSGKLRVLGTSGVKRSVALPDVPAIAEALPGYESTVWWGILVPAGTPAPIVDRLNNELKTILALDEIKKWFLNQGAEVDYLGPTEFGTFLEREMAKWARVIKKANIRLEE
jgi:tripartite-type tricarboxylate transporter receptor subunit TctC